MKLVAGMFLPSGDLFLCLMLAATTSIVVASSGTADPFVYTAHDDATWAVMSNQLSSPDKQGEYNEFMESCRVAAGEGAQTYCDNDESYRISMNMRQPQSVSAIIYAVVASVYSLSRSRFKRVKNRELFAKETFPVLVKRQAATRGNIF